MPAGGGADQSASSDVTGDHHERGCGHRVQQASVMQRERGIDGDASDGVEELKGRGGAVMWGWDEHGRDDLEGGWVDHADMKRGHEKGIFCIYVNHRPAQPVQPSHGRSTVRSVEVMHHIVLYCTYHQRWENSFQASWTISAYEAQRDSMKLNEAPRRCSTKVIIQ